jgi:putative DNA primase/helicase
MNDAPKIHLIDYDALPEPPPPAFSDEALALRFAEEHAGHLRYVDVWNKWLVWDERRWAVDETRKAFDLSRALCRAAASEAKGKTAKQIASAKTVYAVTNLARSDRRIAATVAQWDSDPWLLNTPGGVVDLLCGSIRPHIAQDYMTKITAVSPDPNCPIPLWRSVLKRATGDDQDLQDYLQRLFGYGLTGSTREHSLHFAYGTGANSKGTILGAIQGCFGDYHTSAPIETFTASNVDRHPTELAKLRGARLVTSVETEQGRRWAESRIKQLTGGDVVSARFMRQDFFDFTPQFTLFIVGNHKPGLRSVDEAIRRRFHLIPFNITIPQDERDPELGEKLEPEYAGILQWCIDGCVAWYRQGLAAPRAVTEATAAYLKSEDAVVAWIDDECDCDPNAWERSQNLFGSWRSWAERAGEPIGNMKDFRERLEAHSIHHKPQPGTNRAGYQGLRLRPKETDYSDAYWNR